MQYQVVHVNSYAALKSVDALADRGVQQLNERVLKLIAEGWKPQGGACISVIPAGIVLTQAMIKD